MSAQDRIDAISRQIAQQGKRDPALQQFRVATTCPPSTRLYVRAGVMWNVYPGDGYAWDLPSATVDLSDNSNIYGTDTSPLYDHDQSYQITFDTAYYYRVYTLLIKMPYDTATGIEWRLVDLEIEAEFATAGEAEAAWSGTVAEDMLAWFQGFPLCGLILRNDGTVGVPGAIQPIDSINRGRSYLWPRDVRPLEYRA